MSAENYRWASENYRLEELGHLVLATPPVGLADDLELLPTRDRLTKLQARNVRDRPGVTNSYSRHSRRLTASAAATFTVWSKSDRDSSTTGYGFYERA